MPNPERHRKRTAATLLGHVLRTVRGTSSHSVSRLRPGRDEATHHQAELAEEMQLARDIQQGLLLQAVPRLPGWEISAVSLPARSLGGDLYDFLPLDEGRHGIMIGDVSGKGLPAALRMAVARTVFRHEARRAARPAQTLAEVNRGVLQEIPQGMVTMLYATLDLRNGTLCMANAGHLYPVLINGRVREVELSGLPLGVDPESEYVEDSITLRPGDTVLLYTDGVVEAINAADEYFGYDRLTALLGSQTRSKPRALVSALLQELRLWSCGRQADDITMVVLRRRFDQVSAELRSVAADVLGEARATVLWESIALPSLEAATHAWAATLPAIMQEAQQRFGRGLARELNAQLRLALEEYREESV